MSGAILSTGKKNYTTPEWICEEVRKFFRKVVGNSPDETNDPGIDLDPCSNPQSHVRAGLNVMLEDPALPFTLGLGTVLSSAPELRFQQGDGLTMSWYQPSLFRVVAIAAGAIDVSRDYWNPPFGYDKATKIGIKNWIYKAMAERAVDPRIESIGCIPDCPETIPWKNGLLLKAQGRCQLARRVKFGGMTTGIPKPISLVYLGSNPQLFKDHFKHFGRVENPSVVYADQADLKL